MKSLTVLKKSAAARCLLSKPRPAQEKAPSSKKFCNVTRISNFPFLSPRANPAAQDAFYEYVDSQYGSRYGTLRSEVDSFINVGEDVLFDMDWEGARQMKEKAGDDVVTIYLLPPSIKELRRRLEGRGTDSKEIIDKRMKMVFDKIEHWDEFDYVIVNVNLEETILKVQKIISGERMKRVRQTGMKRFVNELIKEAKENE